ncbi:MAG: 5'-deoxynucleotidase [Lachnospiraceae bacterium]|nr:5'-deoxynucleotidase [Lachnospiraceae bacterium]
MENYNFFAMLSRMKYINRWGLMRNTITENIAEHSLETGMIAHALAIIRNVYFGGNINPDKVAVYAMYHDAPEIITGDLPTPVKYFAPEIKSSYKVVEEMAVQKLLHSLPSEMKPFYEEILNEDDMEEEYRVLVKAADKISALIKCVEEKRMGNLDFSQAEQSTLKAIQNLNCKEADYFIDKFLGAYSLTLDEQA